MVLHYTTATLGSRELETGHLKSENVGSCFLHVE